jgi:hypothetical protein
LIREDLTRPVGAGYNLIALSGLPIAVNYKNSTDYITKSIIETIIETK